MKQIIIVMALVLFLVACIPQKDCDCPDYEDSSCEKYENLVDRKFGLEGCDKVCSKPVCVDFTEAEMDAIRQAERAEADRKAFEENIANFNFRNCWNTSEGWECDFDVDTYLKIKTTIENISQEEAVKLMEKEYVEVVGSQHEKCKDEGGLWRSVGWVPPLEHFYCHFSFEDAGKVCTSSGQCRGSCAVENSYVYENYKDNETEYVYDEELDPEHRFPTHIKCKDNCTGTCVEYPYLLGEGWPTIYTAENGLIAIYLVPRY